jgi:hypothetical protein
MEVMEEKIKKEKDEVWNGVKKNFLKRKRRAPKGVSN